MQNPLGKLPLMVAVLLAIMPLVSNSSDKLSVYTVNYPLQYFTERIGGNIVDVHFPAPQDVDPAFWVPDAKTVAAYQKADLIILNGAGYARWVNKVSLPRLRIVDTSRVFADHLITEQDMLTHSHGPGGEHSHSETAFTTWLDFSQAIQQAEAILAALQHKRPDDSDYFSRNFKKLKQDLKSLDTAMLALPDKVTGKVFMASHPVYQYLARRYRLELGTMTWEPDEFPGQEQWQQFSQTLGRQPVQWMLWEDNPLEMTEQRLSEMGISTVVFAPCMNVPDTGDFLSIMQQNVENLREKRGQRD